MTFNLSHKKIYVAGHTGMAGQAVCRRLQSEDCDILTVPRADVDLTNQVAVQEWFKVNNPDVVIICAAKVGGIHANKTYPADFLYQNMMIEANIIHAAYQFGVEKLLFLGSSCIYPRDCAQPITEDALFSGPLEPTNEAYAVAKITGVKLCQSYRHQYGCDFISVMPTNLYGAGDNFHPDNAHVPAALLSRFHQAKINGDDVVTIWGTGTPRREFLYVDDVADGLVFALQNYSGAEPINIGTGVDISILDFATMVADVVGYQGQMVFDTSRPDGTPWKVLNVRKMLDMGWRATTSLEDGLKHYYQWYLDHQQSLRAA